MTHKDIYTKFLIGYDKANVTSSYPSLTEYEAATLLDRAYLALIGLKFTGNNPRRVPFEYDEKAIADLAPLVKHADIKLGDVNDTPATNIVKYNFPIDFMYYVSSSLNLDVNGTPMDGQTTRLVPTKLVTHQMAEKFFNTPYNMPWVKNPVSFIEGNSAFVVYDPVNKPDTNGKVHLSYIKKPASFVECMVNDGTGGSTDPTHYDPEEGVFVLDISQLDSQDKIQ